MLLSDAAYTYIFSIVLLLIGFCAGIIIPLFLDSLEPTTTALLNLTGPNFTGSDIVPLLPSTPAWQKIDPLVQIAFSMCMDSVFLGIALLVVTFCFPGQITERERSYPKRYLVIVGVTQAASALMFQFASPGERTAPYLQAFIGNFGIPIMFVLRFLLLRKRPTLRKGVCALAITVAGLVSLIPTFLPELETEKQHDREGGGTGPWRVIWPIIFVCSGIPFAVSKIVLETSVKFTKPVHSTGPSVNNVSPANHNTRDISSNQSHSTYGSINAEIVNSAERQNIDSQSHDVPPPEENCGELCEQAYTPNTSVLGTQLNKPTSDRHRLNIVYTLFWTFFSTFLGTVSLFWADFIPGFGMQRNVKEFLPQVAFNMQCMFGLTPVCGAVPIALGWTRLLLRTASFVLAALIIRYGEGANFYVLFSSVLSPLKFAFWTLFEEHPFHWKPRVQLSTWFSIGSILVMIPAVILYERGAPEVSSSPRLTQLEVGAGDRRDGETRPLIST